MVDKEFIRKKHYCDGWSIRELSRRLGVARQTVRKALADAEPPRYRLSAPRPCSVMEPCRALILAWLEEDEQAPAKQRHTARRIYHRLRDEYGFQGSESTVRRHVASLRPRTPEVMLPLAAAWGQQAQVDWGQAQVRIAGEPVVAHLFCLRMRASGVCSVWPFRTEKLEAFLAGHRQAFEWLSGVPAECLYDNPKTAVARILAGPEREEHTHFSSLRAHYLFDSLFCRPGQAHEKGAVENLVGYVRRNALVPVPDLPSWEALEAHLTAWCEQERQRRQDAWLMEQAKLRPLPRWPFRCALTRLCQVNRLSLITYDRNRYSVPCHYVGRTVQVFAYADRIEVVHGDRSLACHGRRYGRGETVLELEHYLPALARKPRAAAHLAVVPMLPPVYTRVRERLLRARRDGYRDFCAILLLHRDFPSEAVTRALEQAEDRGLVTADAVRQILLNETSHTPGPLVVPTALAQARVRETGLEQYDCLLTGRECQT